MPFREAGAKPLHPAARADAPAAETPRDRAAAMLARQCLEDMKAEETVEIDLIGKTSIADTMIVTSGRSNRHVGSIADRVVEALKRQGFGSPRVEGVPACDWVLIDAGDLIIHVFRPEVRSFYNLEKMWGSSRPREAPPEGEDGLRETRPGRRSRARRLG